MDERTFKLIVEYDGAGFSGWQIQPDKRTVQAEIERSLQTILRHPVRVAAAGRTDAGVHAAGQVVSFDTPAEIEPSRIKRAVNGLLPEDVTVIDAAEVSPGFNARFDAQSRTYRYTLSGRRVSLGRGYLWRPKYSLSRELLEEATRPLKGECSLEGFSRKNEDGDFMTVIFKSGWTFREHFMIFEIQAVRFFHNAVRGIVGSAVEVGRGYASPDLLKRILETKERSLAGPVAPPHGLCLISVDYVEG